MPSKVLLKVNYSVQEIHSQMPFICLSMWKVESAMYSCNDWNEMPYRPLTYLPEFGDIMQAWNFWMKLY